MRKLINTAFVYAIAAMAAGVFYREFTRFNGFSGRTALSFVHGHFFMLGMLFFLVAALLNARLSFFQDRMFKGFFVVYNAGLAVTGGTLAWRGVTQVLDMELSRGMDAAISGVAGIGHILLGVGIVLFFLVLRRRAR